MFASDFVRLYALLSRIENMRITDLTPTFVGKLQADAIGARIALDVCVLPKIQNVEILNEISISQQSPDVDGTTGDNGVQV